MELHNVMYRPASFADYVGDPTIKARLLMAIEASRRGEPLPHMLFLGGPGLGKTTLAKMVANESQRAFFHIMGDDLKEKKQLDQLFVMPPTGTVMLLDEAHSIGRNVLEHLYTLMEDGTLSGTADATKQFALPGPLTVIGATTEVGELPKPFVDRFRLQIKLKPYSVATLADMGEKIVSKFPDRVKVALARESLELVAGYARGVPRLMGQYLYQLKDLLVVTWESEWSMFADDAARYMAYIGRYVPGLGLDDTDVAVLTALRNGPQSGQMLALTAGEAMLTVQKMHEPFLVASGLMTVTMRGRELTLRGAAAMTYARCLQLGVVKGGLDGWLADLGPAELVGLAEDSKACAEAYGFKLAGLNRAMEQYGEDMYVRDITGSTGSPT